MGMASLKPQLQTNPNFLHPSTVFVESPVNGAGSSIDDFEYDRFYEDYLDEGAETSVTGHSSTGGETSISHDKLDIQRTSTTSTSGTTQSKSQIAQAKLKTTYEDVRYFAGGLISHPYEATKHYSILRHSHGLVYYSGPYTSLAISVFADRPLPPDRTFWLQRKGWSGKTGLKAGVMFGTKGAWIEVTPSVTATADQLNPSDERAWQRDIKKFLNKGPKQLRNHVLRETNILRIPCEADDGYLRVVMCAGERGKKYLCPSPVFRLASTSTTSSSMRGASLTTMPIEIGVKVASVLATNVAATLLGPVTETTRTFVSDQVASVYQPGAVEQTAMTSAYDASGVQDRIDGLNDEYDTSRDASYQRGEAGAYDALDRPGIVGNANGPERPFPVRFQGKVVPGLENGRLNVSMPTADLTNIDNELLLRYGGVYFGWAAVSQSRKQQAESPISADWHESVIFIVPCTMSFANVVQKKIVKVCILHDFQRIKFYNGKLSVLMMGFLRPVAPSSPQEQHYLDDDTQLFDFHKDIAVTLASLSRPNWQAEATLRRIKSAASSRSFTERYVDMRTTGQKHIDKVPVHRLGIRTDSHAVRDRLVGNGGVSVLR